MGSLPPLPSHPAGVPWPTRDWPTADPDARVDAERLERAFEAAFAGAPDGPLGETLAAVCIHRGRLAAERYAPDRGPEETFVSWSMAKSVTHALVGLLVGDGRLDPHAPAAVPRWSGAGDPRGAITLEHLLRMVDGLDFTEDYVDEGRSDVIEMLFGAGKADVAAFAESRPAAHPPGRVWNYSSGTTNVVSALVGRCVGGGREGMEAFLRERLFGPLGMRSTTARFDDAGTFIGSSFVFATARDFARFGLLYLRGGVWGPDATPLLPAGWVDHARTVTPASAGEYGAHWWLALDGSGIFSANGYNGQYLVLVPDRDLVVVRLGVTPAERRGALLRWLRDVVECFPLLPDRPRAAPASPVAR